MKDQLEALAEHTEAVEGLVIVMQKVVDKLAQAVLTANPADKDGLVIKRAEYDGAKKAIAEVRRSIKSLNRPS